MPSDDLEDIAVLHCDNYAEIRWGLGGEISDRVPIKRGVRQGFVLAPTPFPLFLNNMSSHLMSCINDCPEIGGLKTPILLFANNSFLLSRTATGLQNLINSFEQFCHLMGLELNTLKLKCMVFRGHRTRSYGFQAKVPH